MSWPVKEVQMAAQRNNVNKFSLARTQYLNKFPIVQGHNPGVRVLFYDSEAF